MDQVVKDAEARLNELYPQIKSQIEQIPSLENKSEIINNFYIAQAAWEKYRDSYCNLMQELYAGGSIAPYLYSECVAELTLNRIENLENFSLLSQ